VRNGGTPETRPVVKWETRLDSHLCVIASLSSS
jgi:hypothetical protein